MFTVLRLPGTLRAFIPALIGRIALAMAGLGLLLTVHTSSGSYTAAGIASATFGIANVAAAPWRARAVDRWGQQRALLPLGLAHAGGFVLLAELVAVGAPLLPLVVTSILIGLTAPPLGAAMRAVWASKTEAGDSRRHAFSVDAVAEELLFVLGPVVIATTITTTTASVGLLLIAAIVTVGTLAFTTSPASRAQARSGSKPVHADLPLQQPGFLRVLVALLGVGCVIGVTEIVAPAFADSHRQAAAAGWLLAAFAAGSASGGLLYGRIRWKASLGTILLLLSAGMGVAAIASSFLTTVVGLAVGMAAIGAFLAPSLITGYLVADTVVPEAGRTEASTWVNTAVNLGAALASALAGVIIDHSDPRLPLVVAGGLVIVTACFVPRSLLRTPRTARTPRT